MQATIQLKSGSGAPPAALAVAEPAFDTASGDLFIGDGTTNWRFARAFAVTAVKTGTYTAGYWQLVRYDASGGAFTVNLPTAIGKGGTVIGLKNTTTSTNNLTIDGFGSQTIDGALTLVVATARAITWLMSDDANWMVI